jgi:hypothetical protein
VGNLDPVLDNHGNVLPAHVALEGWGDALPLNMSNFALRFGEVQEVVYPDSDKSLSKRFVEYSVYVQEMWGAYGGGRVYTNCVLLNSLAGLADIETYALRATPTASSDPGGDAGHGSKVLVLCINGNERCAVILGGVRDQADESESGKTDGKNAAKALGQFYKWRFNGLSFDVNDDGELTITFNGKTKDDGAADDSVEDGAPGAQVQILKDGSILQATASGNESWKLDHKNKKVAGKADQFTFDHKKGVKIGQATDKMMLGSTYRDAETLMHNTMDQILLYMEEFMTAAGAQLTAAGGSMAVPIVGPVVASPNVTSTGAQMVALSQMIGQFRQAIQDFEAKKAQFLSATNSLD